MGPLRVPHSLMCTASLNLRFHFQISHYYANAILKKCGQGKLKHQD